MDSNLNQEKVLYTGSALGASAAVTGTSLATTGLNLGSMTIGAFTLLLLGSALLRIVPRKQR